MSIDDGSGGLAILDQPSAPDPEPAPTAADDGRRKKLLVILAIVAVLLLLVGSVLAWYLINRKPLSSLPILGREAMPTYQTAIYGVDKPLGVAVTEDGSRIFVTQSGGKRTVVVFDHEGNVLKTLAAPKDKAKGHLPAYVAINEASNEVAVSDVLAKAVYVYDVNGNYIRTVKPTGLTGSFAPLAVAYGPSGELYVSEIGSKVQRIVVLDSKDALVRTFAPTDAPFAFPNGIAVGEDGTVFVSDSNNGRMIAFDAQGSQVGAANRGIGEGDLGMPRGIAVTKDNRIYVADTTNQVLHAYKFDSGAADKVSFLGAFGDQGTGDGLFEYPNGVAVDGRSDVYITDRENGRIQVWS